METFKAALVLLFQCLLFLNAAGGMWSAKTLRINKDYKKAIGSSVYALSSFLIFLLVVSTQHVKLTVTFLILINILLSSSLFLFTIDRIRGKSESLARRGKL